MLINGAGLVGTAPLSRRRSVKLSVARQDANGTSRVSNQGATRKAKGYRSAGWLDDDQQEEPTNIFTFSGLLNTLSETAFGSDTEESYTIDRTALPPSSSESVEARGRRATASSGRPSLLEAARWGLGALYRGFIRAVGKVQGRRMVDLMNDADLPQVSEEQFQRVSSLMGGVVSRYGLRRMAYKYPPCLSMPSSELAGRLLGLKVLLPGCDVCFLVEDQPSAFLGGKRSEVEGQVAKAVALMQHGLAGANLNELIMRDPEILFFRGLETGLLQLRDLWDVDEAAMQESDAAELALAVRSLANTRLSDWL